MVASLPDAPQQASEPMRSTLRFVESAYDASTVHVAIVDANGCILTTNAAWKRFSERYALRKRGWGTGTCYLDELDRVTGPEAGDATRLAEGIRAVLRGDQTTYELQYARRDVLEERRYNVRVSRLDLEGEPRAVVVHADVTDQTLASRHQQARFRFTRTLAAARSLDEAAPELLRELGEATQWEIAELWRVHGGSLERAGAWHATDEALHDFAEQAAGVRLERSDGDGVSGSPELSAVLGSIRRRLHDEIGLRFVMTLPIGRPGAVRGVLLLLARHIHPPDAAIVALLEDVCAQIAQFLVRCEAEESLERRAAELARAEAVQREQATLLACIIDSVADGIVVADDQMRLIHFNRAAQRIIGLNPADEDPVQWPKAYGMHHPDGRLFEPEEQPLVRAVRGESTDDVKMLVRNPRAQEAQFSVSGRPLAGPDGRSRGGVVVFRDETERRRVEEELRAKDEQLHRAHRLEAVGRLAGGVAHDFNNLLTAITSYASFLVQALDANTPEREDATAIVALAKRASELTRQLLSFSRQQTVEPRLFDAGQVVRDMAKLLQRLIGEDVRLELDIAETPCPVEADPGQFEQVLVNLIVNSRDAMPEGGRITVGVARTVVRASDSLAAWLAPGSYVTVSVADTGSGVSEEVRAKIFEPFFTTKDGAKGTGLGLATVYGIVKQAGGHIEVESVEGRGATFTFYVPLTEQAVEERAHAPLAAPETHGREHVLLVEDEAEVRRAARRALRAQGYQVTEAASPGEALLIMEREGETIDLLLTDVVLPFIKGPDLYQRIRALHPDLPVLFATGYASPDQLATLPQDAPLLRKPYTPAQLTSRVREVLNASRER